MFEHFIAIWCILVHYDANHECTHYVVQHLKLKGQLWERNVSLNVQIILCCYRKLVKFTYILVSKTDNRLFFPRNDIRQVAKRGIELKSAVKSWYVYWLCMAACKQRKVKYPAAPLVFSKPRIQTMVTSLKMHPSLTNVQDKHRKANVMLEVGFYSWHRH